MPENPTTRIAVRSTTSIRPGTAPRRAQAHPQRARSRDRHAALRGECRRGPRQSDRRARPRLSTTASPRAVPFRSAPTGAVLIPPEAGRRSADGVAAWPGSTTLSAVWVEGSLTVPFVMTPPVCARPRPESSQRAAGLRCQRPTSPTLSWEKITSGMFRTFEGVGCRRVNR